MILSEIHLWFYEWKRTWMRLSVRPKAKYMGKLHLLCDNIKSFLCFYPFIGYRQWIWWYSGIREPGSGTSTHLSHRIISSRILYTHQKCNEYYFHGYSGIQKKRCALVLIEPKFRSKMFNIVIFANNKNEILVDVSIQLEWTAPKKAIFFCVLR